MTHRTDNDAKRRQVHDIIIQHDTFHQVLEQMESKWRDARAGISIVKLFVGETGTGKTTAIEFFCAQHPRKRKPEGLMTPVLTVNVPSKPTPGGLGERILQALGDPRASKGSATAKLDRIVTNLRAAEVEILILDDLQHFVDKRQQIALYDTSDYLKELVINYNLGLLCFGLPGCELVIQSNEQLKTRSTSVYEIRRFDWTNQASQDQFVGVLASFKRGIKGFDLPDLTSPDLALRMYLATGGLMRYVTDILSNAVGRAIDSGSKRIRLEDLSNAWSEEVFDSPNEPISPLSRSFTLDNLPPKIAHAKTIAQKIPRPESSRSRRPRDELARAGL